jgi:uncharacterized alkaline shock family protein YloU
MTSVQRKFAASLITLLVALSLSYAGQTTKLTPDDCDENSALATTIRGCLASQGIKPAKLCTTAGRIETPGRIEVTLSEDIYEPGDCKVINAIRKCTLVAVNYERGYELYVSIAPSAGGAPAQLVYNGHTGTEHDPDTMPKCIDVLALKFEGTLKFKLGRVESKVKEDAKRLGVRIDDLDVKVKKREGDKLGLRVSGKVRAAEVSEAEVKEIVTDLVSKYTGVRVLAINIDELNTDKLKAPITKR